MRGRRKDRKEAEKTSESRKRSGGRVRPQIRLHPLFLFIEL